ncbi:MAG: phosphate ABC transporter substrate-binding protein PstS [Acidobacteria bacterium]|nr:phosphate ABC transporter substrate-binding protein PstS [Acidobacteriota bacterium]
MLLLCLLILSTGGCGGTKDGAEEVSLQGAGATFPYPLYSKWISEYHKVNARVRLDYQSIGSGGGIKQLTERTVDFGASDVPMTDEQLRTAAKEVLHIPSALGAVAVIYNLPGVASGLKITSDLLADIFLGKITKWNHPGISAHNPGVSMPNADILVVHRTDGSGTTAVFVDYLNKVSSEWVGRVGRGTSVNWPAGIGGKGNEGVAGQVKQTAGSIGYVELAYAEQNQIAYAEIRNRSGIFLKPSVANITAAAASMSAQVPDDLRVSITDAEGPAVYPISALTYILVFREQVDEQKGKAVGDFLWWAIHDGQKFTGPLQYAPLPDDLVKKTETRLRLLSFNNQPLLHR